jgi:hypothetical protein
VRALAGSLLVLRGLIRTEPTLSNETTKDRHRLVEQIIPQAGDRERLF